ncbi:MAG: IS21-like element helper ATPase IstB [Armatimonadota bacterium]
MMHLETTLSQLREMRLSVMADALQRRLEHGDQQGLSGEEFAALLIEDEYCARQQRKLARLIGQANFKPEGACLANVRYAATRGVEKRDLMAFTTPAWIQGAHNLILTGATGTGKTYLAEAIGLQACQLGYSVRKLRYKTLFEELNAAHGTGLFLKALKRLQLTRVLILDDFLMTPATPDDLANLLEIIEDRSQLGPLVITTQYPPSAWHALMPDPTMADAICDRLIHTSTLFTLQGDSQRKQNQTDK